ncbi:MAG: nucleoside-triphosphatase [Nanoarchaeota archaeon]|nr:nucleoside-triphosphatase [Nanoarchaeota archaeon]
MKKNLILTGLPRSGKSTLVKKVLEHVPQRFGFWTEEVVEGGVRMGFNAVNHKGHPHTLAIRDYPSMRRVGPYGVLHNDFDEFVAPLWRIPKSAKLVYLDEVGPMQLLSPEFIDLIPVYLAAPQPFFATMAVGVEEQFRRDGLVPIVSREDVELVEITPDNRELREKEVTAWLKYHGVYKA